MSVWAFKWVGGGPERPRGEFISSIPSTAQGKAVPEYEATAAATRALKAQVERALTALLKGRRVHVMGDINTL